MKFPMIQKNCHVQPSKEDKIKSSIFCWFELHFMHHCVQCAWCEKQHTIDKLNNVCEPESKL